MKILLTGGGTGGHFYPLIAVAKALNAVADQEKIANLELVYMAEHPLDKKNKNKQSKNKLPANPNSSANTAKIESLTGSGR